MSKQQRFFFMSTGHSISRMGVTVLEAFRCLVDESKEAPIPAWLLTDAIRATTSGGVFIKVQDWGAWCAELAEADRQDADETTECDMCQGTGKVVDPNFQMIGGQMYSDPCNMECPDCNGVGRIDTDDQVRLQISREDNSEDWRE